MRYIVNTIMTLAIAATTLLFQNVSVRGEELQKPVSPVDAGPVTEGFQLSARAEKEVFAPNEPILLQITLKNVTKRTLVHVVGSHEDYPVIVKDEEGKNVPPTRYKRQRDSRRTSFAHGSMDIDSGEEVKSDILVNRMYDMTKSGTYFITASHSVPNSDKTRAVRVMSNTVQVKVLKNSSPSSAQVTKLEAGPIFQGFQLAVQAEKSTVEAGEMVVLLITLKNTTKNTLDVYEHGTDKDFELEVKNAGGEVMPLTSHGRDSKVKMKLNSMSVGPGQEIRYRLRLSRLVDMSVSGSYPITVKRWLPNPNFGDKDRRLDVEGLVSNPVEVQITEPNTKFEKNGPDGRPPKQTAPSTVGF